MKELKWWTIEDLERSSEIVFPGDLAKILRSLAQPHRLLDRFRLRRAYPPDIYSLISMADFIFTVLGYGIARRNPVEQRAGDQVHAWLSCTAARRRNTTDRIRSSK